MVFAFVLPLCLYVAFTDLARMKITNKAVAALGAVYVILGPLVLPSVDVYLWGFAQFAIALGIGVALNALGAMGAGDAKFIACAAPFVAPGDLTLVFLLFTCVLAASLLTHRGARPAGCAASPRTGSAGHRATVFPWASPLARPLPCICALARSMVPELRHFPSVCLR